MFRHHAAAHLLCLCLAALGPSLVLGTPATAGSNTDTSASPNGEATAAPVLMEPEGEPILTVSGQIEVSNGEGVATFDLAMLDALPSRETTAETPWYDGVRTFSGPLLSEVLHAVGVEGHAIRLQAVNSYETTIPYEDIAAYPVILATRIDGQTLSVREKGPLFVIYPFDSDPSLYNETYYGRSIWQVVAIKVLDS